MAIIFDWRKVADVDWAKRYTDAWARLERALFGFEAWNGVEWGRLESPDEEVPGIKVPGMVVSRRIREFRAGVAMDRVRRGAAVSWRKPCVFVSHRYKDVDLAEDIAEMIERVGGYDVWLDIWDPHLAKINSWAAASIHSQAAISFAIAATIEMGLVNSERVIAVMTDNAGGSKWIPYEYGRVKDDKRFGREAAAWLADDFRPGSNMGGHDYMLLGPQIRREPELKAWLNTPL